MRPFKCCALLCLLPLLVTAACGDTDSEPAAAEESNNDGGDGGKADIIGEDDRQDLFAFEDGSLPKRLARSTAMVMSSTQLDQESDPDHVILRNMPTLGNARQLCDDQPFVEQPSVGFCTAFLVAPDIVVTAGHCLTERECPTTSFIFGFGYEEAPEDPIEDLRQIPKEDVYACAEFISVRAPQECGDADGMIIRLDRPVEGREVLTYRREGQIEPDTEIFMIGHPDGVPSKVATGLTRDPISEVVFKDNLDSFGGNSGSPVFNAETGVVEGIRSCSSGEHSVPSEDDPSCKVLYQCEEDGSDCDIVLGTTYSITHLAPILDGVLGIEDEVNNDAPPASPCCVSQEGGGCGDEEIEACVCAEDDFCCTTQWDGGCAAQVERLGCGSCQ